MRGQNAVCTSGDTEELSHIGRCIESDAQTSFMGLAVSYIIDDPNNGYQRKM
jgi:hypothetical protein